MAIDPTTEIGRVRLQTGDIDTENPFFEDTIYQHYLDEGLGEIGAAIEILEAMIQVYALTPERERAGRYESYNINLAFLDSRLDELKKKKYQKKGAPVIINAGQKNWDSIDTIFGRDC